MPASVWKAVLPPGQADLAGEEGGAARAIAAHLSRQARGVDIAHLEIGAVRAGRGRIEDDDAIGAEAAAAVAEQGCELLQPVGRQAAKLAAVDHDEVIAGAMHLDIGEVGIALGPRHQPRPSSRGTPRPKTFSPSPAMP